MGRKAKVWQPTTTAAARDVKRVMGYVRVSTGDQAAEGFGLASQRDAITAYCAAAGYELVAVHADEGISGTLGPDQRPGLAAILAAAEAGEIDAVITKALDRIGRHPRVAAAVFDVLDRAGVKFVSITEPELASDLLRGLFAGIASDERKKIVERTSSGRIAKAEGGGYAGGRVPFGYKLTGYRKSATWEIDPDAAAIVRRIFTERAQGRTYAAIADTLNAEGIPSPAGGRWVGGRIHAIATNPAYLGNRRHREQREVIAQGEYPPIVDAQGFLQRGRGTEAA